MEQTMEGFLFEFLDQCKLLFFPEQWNNTFLDCSKNEVFAMIYVYRKGHANMTEIAEYLGIPLNTATGIISRLEKRGMVIRERDVVDKRVVTIAMQEDGKQFLAEQFQLLERYYQLFMNTLSEDEKLMLIGLVSRFLDVVTKDLMHKDSAKDTKRFMTVKRFIVLSCWYVRHGSNLMV